MTVCRGKGLALHVIAKCAGSTIKVAFLEGVGVERPDDGPHWNPALNRCNPNECPDLYCAAFVRDPVARTVSCWADKIARDKGTGTKGLLRTGAYRVGMRLDEFVEALPPVRDRDVHTRAQHLFLSDRMDFMGRVENLQKDWQRLRRRFMWLPQRLGRYNTTEGRDISADVVKRIKRIYADDYEQIEILAQNADC